MKSPIVGAIVAALFVAAVPVFLIAASVAWAINDLGLYARGFDKYDIPTATGIEREDLIQVGREIQGYFNSTREPLEVRTTIYGREQALFNYREVIHMADVKGLIWGVYGVGALALLYMVGVGVAGFVRQGRSFAHALCRRILWGAEATVGLVALVGLISLVAFDRLFLLFHQVSFGQRFLAVGSAAGLPDYDVSTGVLAGRDAIRGVPDAGRSGGFGRGVRGIVGVSEAGVAAEAGVAVEDGFPLSRE